MWQIDTSYGPYLYDEKGKNPKRLYIIAAIDDASRLIVGQGLFFRRHGYPCAGGVEAGDETVWLT